MPFALLYLLGFHFLYTPLLFSSSLLSSPLLSSGIAIGAGTSLTACACSGQCRPTPSSTRAATPLLRMNALSKTPLSSGENNTAWQLVGRAV
jgi:hypothetical protein